MKKEKTWKEMYQEHERRMKVENTFKGIGVAATIIIPILAVPQNREAIGRGIKTATTKTKEVFSKVFRKKKS